MSKQALVTLFYVFLMWSQIVICQSQHEKVIFETKEIFPLQKLHVHASTIVELPNGDLLAAWFQGSGERQADDVVIMGSRLRKGQPNWSVPFVMADVPGFPDINPVLFIDTRNRLWLIWYTVIAHQWETSLLKYRVSENYMILEGPPKWLWQDVLLVKPGSPAERGIQPDDRFVLSVKRQFDDYTQYLESHHYFTDNEITAKEYAQKWQEHVKDILAKANGENMIRKGREYDAKGKSITKSLGYPYFRRMGWQTKNKPVILDGKRLILPLYSDGLDFSLMAITDDLGENWKFSESLAGAANIQPSIAIKSDGTLIAYMRDNGPPPKRLHISSSTDRGMTWSPVQDSELPNPGSGADLVTLKNGHWILVYNDTEQGRNSLAVSLSTNDGKSWDQTRRLELDTRENNATRSHYPSIIQGRDGSLHVVYSYHHNDRNGGPHKTIKYAHFNEEWVK